MKKVFYRKVVGQFFAYITWAEIVYQGAVSYQLIFCCAGPELGFRSLKLVLTSTHGNDIFSKIVSTNGTHANASPVRIC